MILFRSSNATNRVNKHSPLSHRYDQKNTNSITRLVKVNVRSYDGKLDLDTFLNWLDELDNYFDLYIMIDRMIIHFAKTKLVGATKQY